MAYLVWWHFNLPWRPWNKTHQFSEYDILSQSLGGQLDNETTTKALAKHIALKQKDTLILTGKSGTYKQLTDVS